MHRNSLIQAQTAAIERLEPRRLLSDTFEPNNSLATATNFGMLGDREEFGLDISPSGDQDFYKFTALGSGNIQIRINMIVLFGDLDLFLYGPSNTVVAQSIDSGNTDEINYNVVEGLTYTINVAGVQGNTNNYDLRIDGPDSSTAGTPDRFEPNNSFAAATNLGTLGDRTENDLNIHEANNDDYYKFTAGSSGPATIGISFTHAAGDLDLFLYASDQSSLKSSEGQGNSETINHDLTGGQVYYVRVIGFDGDTNPQYSLSIDGPALPAPTVGTKTFAYETAHVIQFVFDQDVSSSLDIDDLTVVNQSTSQTIANGSFTFNKNTNNGMTTATWTAMSPLPDGRYVATLNGAGVTNAGGTPIAGSPALNFTVLAGDADNDGDVDVSDLGVLATHWQQSGQTFSGGNFDYSPNGSVDVNDLGLLATNWQKSLAAPSAPFAKPARKTASRLIDQVETL
jgi:hypothetical protein